MSWSACHADKLFFGGKRPPTAGSPAQWAVAGLYPSLKACIRQLKSSCQLEKPPIDMSEAGKAGHDALPASAGCPEDGSHLSASRVGCGSSLGCWGHWEDNQGRGRSSFFLVQFLWDHPWWACGTRRGQFPPIEQTCFWVATRIYARRHSHRVIVAQLR